MSRAWVHEIPCRNHQQRLGLPTYWVARCVISQSDIIEIVFGRTGQDGAGGIPAERQKTSQGLRAEEQRLV